MGWLLLAMVDLSIGRTSVDCTHASVTATKQLKQGGELSGCFISLSGMEEKMSSQLLP
jgi:hypothetical protein